MCAGKTCANGVVPAVPQRQAGRGAAEDARRPAAREGDQLDRRAQGAQRVRSSVRGEYEQRWLYFATS